MSTLKLREPEPVGVTMMPTVATQGLHHRKQSRERVQYGSAHPGDKSGIEILVARMSSGNLDNAV